MLVTFQQRIIERNRMKATAAKKCNFLGMSSSKIGKTKNANPIKQIALD
jgi:hypothetical protein